MGRMVLRCMSGTHTTRQYFAVSVVTQSAVSTVQHYRATLIEKCLAINLSLLHNLSRKVFVDLVLEKPMSKPEPLLNQPAPDFTLLDHEGNRITLSSFRGKHPVLLVFYPGDDTPGCTTQLCAIRDDWAEFQKYGVMAFGVNPGNAESHMNFWRHHGLKTPLLIDEGKQVSGLYGATKKFFATEIIKRSVVLVDMAGTIRYLKRGMPSDQEILAAVRAL